jgi:hypothetical protein
MPYFDRQQCAFALNERMADMAEKMGRQLFTYDRNGLRLAIAALEDEIQELWTEWNNNKRYLSNGKREIQHELLDIAAIAMYAYLESTK